MESKKGKNNIKWPKIGLYISQIRSSKTDSFRIFNAEAASFPFVGPQ